MKTTIRYSILKYIHSRAYNESLNVGVFVEYSEEKKYDLFIPSNFSRLNALYSDFRPTFLKTYLSVLKKRTDELNANTSLFSFSLSDVESDAKSFVLRPDDTALEFGEERTAQIKNQNFVKSFVSGFVPYLFEEPEKRHKHDEPYLKSRFYKSISSLVGIENKVIKDKEITFNDLTFKIDFEWKNGTTNLVKAISFDLQDAGAINNKIAQSAGYLNHFSEFATNNNSRFDLLVSRPTNKQTFKEYDRAINVLDAVKVNKQIIEESNIESYSESALTSLANQA